MGFLFVFCFVFVFVFVLVVWDRVSLCSPGFPGTYSVDQHDLETASASGVLGLKVCTTAVRQKRGVPCPGKSPLILWSCPRE